MDSEDIEVQTRAALWLVLDREPGEVVAAKVGPLCCPNCDAPCASLRSPYCGHACREESALVRQLRAALASGLIAEPDRQAALGQKLWQVLGGGLPRRVAIAPQRAVALAHKREEGRCQVCGGPATTVDHIGSG